MTRLHRLRAAMIIVLCLVGSIFTAYAADTVLAFASEEQEALYQQLTEEFRCLKCQNQNLADSNADLARDLRMEIYDAVIQGKDRQSISEYLVARYGDFVLYRPPVKKVTYLLWFGPFLLLLVAIFAAVRMVSNPPAAAAPEPSEELENARRWLND